MVLPLQGAEFAEFLRLCFVFFLILDIFRQRH